MNYLYPEETIIAFTTHLVTTIPQHLRDEHFSNGHIDEFNQGFNYGLKHVISLLQQPSIIPPTLTFHQGKRTKVSTIYRTSKASMQLSTKWRQAVLHRDNFMCRKCNSTHALEVHHITPAHLCDDDFIYDPSNGITLCHTCHKSFHHTYGTKYNSLTDLLEFL